MHLLASYWLLGAACRLVVSRCWFACNICPLSDRPDSRRICEGHLHVVIVLTRATRLHTETKRRTCCSTCDVALLNLMWTGPWDISQIHFICIFKIKRKVQLNSGVRIIQVSIIEMPKIYTRPNTVCIKIIKNIYVARKQKKNREIPGTLWPYFILPQCACEMHLWYYPSRNP